MSKPYYQDDYVTLYNGDCREILPQIESGSIDMVFTDPPYGHNNNNGDLIHNREVALGKVKKVAIEGHNMLLAGYGNAIVPELAAEFIKAFLIELTERD